MGRIKPMSVPIVVLIDWFRPASSARPATGSCPARLGDNQEVRLRVVPGRALIHPMSEPLHAQVAVGWQPFVVVGRVSGPNR